jgi:hypothetical protein
MPRRQANARHCRGQPEEETIHMLARTDDDKIKIELVKSNFLTRYPCNICGGCTEKVPVLAKGHGLLVCERCLEAGAASIDARLERHAAVLEAMAGAARALIGRLLVPSYAEWQAAMAAVDEEDERFHRALDIARSAEQLAIKHDNIEHDPKVSYRVTFRGGWTSFQTQLGAERFIAEYGEGEIKREERTDDFPF